MISDKAFGDLLRRVKILERRIGNVVISGDGAVDVDPAGALDGDGSAGAPLAVRVDNSTIIIDANELVAVGGGSPGDLEGRLLGIQVITTTGAGTYTPTAGTNSIVIELVGGGPGGGGATTSTAGNGSCAQSGAGAGYVRKRLTANFSGASYVVGAKGTGGAAGNNPGNAATDTTFTDTAPTTYTASKGSPGLGAAADGQVPPSGRIANTGVGTGTNGDLNVSGGVGNPGLVIATTLAQGAKGGDSMMGRAGAAAFINAANTSAAGTNATGFGAGGGGGVVLGTGASVAGGDGSNGVILIWEYS